MHINYTRRYWKFTALAVSVLAIIAAALTLAYQHRGFFAYQYAIRTSPIYASYQTELLELVRKDPAKGIARLRSILAEDPLSYNTCHGITHQMGHRAFETSGFRGAMAVQDAICGGGYVHGVLEGQFGLLQERELFDYVSTLCEDDTYICHHGIGHGLMITTNLNIEKSLGLCDALTGLAARNCYDGVWMHIFDLEESGASISPNRAVDPTASQVEKAAELCTSAEQAYRTSCYFYLPRIFAHGKKTAFSNYVELCTGVETAYQVPCAAGSGHSAMKYHMNDPLAAVLSCNAYDAALRGGCKEGAFIYYLFSSKTTAMGDVDTHALCLKFENTDHQRTCLRVDSYRHEL